MTSDEKIYEVWHRGAFKALFLDKTDAQLFKRRNGFDELRTVTRSSWKFPEVE